MIEVTFQFKTVDEAIVALGKLASVGSEKAGAGQTRMRPAVEGNQPASTPTPTEGQSKRGRGRPRKKAAAVPEPVVSTPAEPAGVVAAPSADAIPAVKERVKAAEEVAHAEADQAAAQGALEKVFNKHGMQSAQAVLLKFGVNRLRDLKAEDRPAFVEACEKAL